MIDRQTLQQRCRTEETTMTSISVDELQYAGRRGCLPFPTVCLWLCARPCILDLRQPFPTCVVGIQRIRDLAKLDVILNANHPGHNHIIVTARRIRCLMGLDE